MLSITVSSCFPGFNGGQGNSLRAQEREEETDLDLPWCRAVYPATSVAFSGLLFSKSNLTMGTEPIAAARCKGSCSRLSLTRAEALWAMSFRARSRLFFEAQKWRAVWIRGCEYELRRQGKDIVDGSG